MNPVTQLKQEILALYREYKEHTLSSTTELKLAGTGETRLIVSEKETAISYVVQDLNMHFPSCFILDGEFTHGSYFNGELHVGEAVVTQNYNSPLVIMSSRGFRRAVGDSYNYKARGVSRLSQEESGLEFEIWNSIVETSLRMSTISPPGNIVDEAVFIRLIYEYRRHFVEPDKKNAFDALSSLITFCNTQHQPDLAILKPFSPENRRFDLVAPDEVVVVGDRITIQTDKAVTGGGKVAVVSKSNPPICLPAAVISSYGQIPMEKSDLRRTDEITRASATQVRLSPFRSYIESFLFFGLVQKYLRHAVPAETQMDDGNMKIYIEGREVVSPR